MTRRSFPTARTSLRRNPVLGVALTSMRTSAIPATIQTAAVGRFGPPSALKLLRKFAPDGLDRVLALAGGKALERCLDFVRPQGRVAYPNGVEPEPVARRAFRTRSFDAVASPREFAKLNRRSDAGKIRVPIAAVYPLARSAGAHRHLQRGHVLGRMVFSVRR